MYYGHESEYNLFAGWIDDWIMQIGPYRAKMIQLGSKSEFARTQSKIVNNNENSMKHDFLHF